MWHFEEHICIWHIYGTNMWSRYHSCFFLADTCKNVWSISPYALKGFILIMWQSYLFRVIKYVYSDMGQTLYTCIHMCTHTCMYIHSCLTTCIPKGIHSYVHVCLTYIFTYIHIGMSIYIQTHGFVSTYIYATHACTPARWLHTHKHALKLMHEWYRHNDRLSCLSVFIHICMHTYKHTYIHAYLSTYILSYVCVDIHGCTFACLATCIYTCIHTYIYTYTLMPVCLHASISTHIQHTCMSAFTHNVYMWRDSWSM